MPRTPPVTEFKIHADSSCMTNSSNSDMTPERTTSNETVVRHDSWTEDAMKEEADKAEEMEREQQKERERERQMDLLEQRIQAAAREVVASMEQNLNGAESELSGTTDESYSVEDTELTCGDGTELTYDASVNTNGSELQSEESSYLHGGEEDEGSTIHSEIHDDGERQCEAVTPHDDDASNHGDVDSDIFNHHSGESSMRSSFNPADSTCRLRSLHSPILGEEAHDSPEESMSRIPSVTSTHHPVHTVTPITPSKTYPRPAFRTPSSVRAIQMSSPTPSLFSSPRSSKRQHPTVSRLGTPTSHCRNNSLSTSKKTPTRFKIKKEYPLVLLHVTLLPLIFPHQDLLTSSHLPPELQPVKETYRLLQEKLAETVLERGILVPHPQDDYEVLEERLLEALELPVRPRARILKCGHYLGPSTITSSSEEEESDGDSGIGSGSLSSHKEDVRKWCDVCGREVSYDHIAMRMQGRGKLFKVKVFASNGLMRAGAWAACWREMERVDVSIEPLVEGQLAVQLEEFASLQQHVNGQERGDVRHEHEEDFITEHSPQKEHQEQWMQDESAHIASEHATRQQPGDQLRRSIQDQARHRETYGASQPPPVRLYSTPTAFPHHPPSSNDNARHSPQTRSISRTSPNSHKRYTKNDSLPTLLFAAFRVAMRDRRNVMIVLLSAVVLLLALRSGTRSTATHIRESVNHGIEHAEQVMGLENPPEMINGVPAKAEAVVEGITSEVPDILSSAIHGGKEAVSAAVSKASEPVKDAVTTATETLKSVASHLSVSNQAPKDEAASPEDQPSEASPSPSSSTKLTPELQHEDVSPPAARPEHAVNHPSTKDHTLPLAVNSNSHSQDEAETDPRGLERIERDIDVDLEIAEENY